VSLLVFDASAVLELLFAMPRAPALLDRLREPGADLHLPALCDVEVGSVLRRLLIARTIGAERAAEVLADYADLPATRHGHLRLLDRALELRSSLPVHDAIYALLAEQLEATLVTADPRLATAARAHTAARVVLA
jgi:predicted nucleic acid-binding protein